MQVRVSGGLAVVAEQVRGVSTEGMWSILDLVAGSPLPAGAQEVEPGVVLVSQVGNEVAVQVVADDTMVSFFKDGGEGALTGARGVITELLEINQQRRATQVREAVARCRADLAERAREEEGRRVRAAEWMEGWRKTDGGDGVAGGSGDPTAPGRPGAIKIVVNHTRPRVVLEGGGGFDWDGVPRPYAGIRGRPIPAGTCRELFDGCRARLGRRNLLAWIELLTDFRDRNLLSQLGLPRPTYADLRCPAVINESYDTPALEQYWRAASTLAGDPPDWPAGADEFLPKWTRGICRDQLLVLADWLQERDDRRYRLILWVAARGDEIELARLLG